MALTDAASAGTVVTAAMLSRMRAKSRMPSLGSAPPKTGGGVPPGGSGATGSSKPPSTSKARAKTSPAAPRSFWMIEQVVEIVWRGLVTTSSSFTKAWPCTGMLPFSRMRRFETRKPLALGVTGVTPSDLEIGSLVYRAEALPSQEGGGRWGLNAGAGLQIALGANVAFLVEGRAFIFQERTITWSRGDARPLTPIEEALADELDRRLEPIEFNPTFIQATAGLAITF